MKVIRTLVKEVEEKLEAIKKWIEMHEQMFDHSSFNPNSGINLGEWMTYYNTIVEKKNITSRILEGPSFSPQLKK